MTDFSSILTSFSKDVIREIRKDQALKRMRATGASANSLSYNADDSSTKIFGEDYFTYQETGRGPGKFPPIRNILRWVRARGIPDAAAFAIAKKIATQGTDVFRGRRKGLSLTEIFEKNGLLLEAEIIATDMNNLSIKIEKLWNA